MITMKTFQYFVSNEFHDPISGKYIIAIGDPFIKKQIKNQLKYLKIKYINILGYEGKIEYEQ